MRRLLLICILVPVIALMTGAGSYGAEIDYGLRFHANTYFTKTESSLLLLDGKVVKTSGKDFTLEFDIRNQKTMQFGSVLRIAPEGGSPLDLIYYVNAQSIFIFAATFADKVIDFPASTTGIGEWHHVKVLISPSAKIINVSFAGEEYSFRDDSVAGMDRFRCVFGSVGQLGAGPEEVANVDIRNILIEKDGETLYKWLLKAHGYGFCLDEVRGAKALETSCEWLSDRYLRWEKEFSITRPDFLGADLGDGKIWIVEESCVERYDCFTGKLDTIQVTGGYPASTADHQIKYVRGSLVSYNMDNGDYSVFSPETGRWSGKERFSGDYCHFNNTTSVDSFRHRLVSFGGYGLYRFSDDLSVLDYKTGEFRKEHMEDLSYRLRPASTIVDGQFFVYGGYGTFNGHQGFAVKYYDDLFRIDPESFRVTKLWASEPADSGNLPCENMIWDEEEHCFYLVRENTGFVLEKISLDAPGCEAVSLPCEEDYIGAAKYPNNLFFCPESGKIYCSIETERGDSSHNLLVLSMCWPPQAAASLQQTLKKGNAWLWALLAFIAASLACACVVFLRKRSAKGTEIKSWKKPEKTSFYDFSKSSIRLLGGFKVRDKDGNDITDSFTPTLKSIFILLILSTPKGGIASGRFDRMIWPYKPEDTTANNRHVYMSRLRPLLEQIGDIKVVSKNKIFSMETSSGVLCDYLEIMHLFGLGRDTDNIRRLTELLVKGSLLPNSEQPWIEPYRRELSSKTVEILAVQLRREDLPEETTLGIADLVLKYDYLNENALRVKCRILAAQGQMGLAKDVYDNFCSEYQDVVGVEFQTSFNKILEQNG